MPADEPVDDMRKSDLARDSRIVTLDDDTLVVRLHDGVGRRNIVVLTGIALLAPVASMGLVALLLPGFRLGWWAAGVGVLLGAMLLFTGLHGQRLLVHSAGDGVVLERHSLLNHRKKRIVLARFTDIEGFDVIPETDECGTAYTLVIVKRSGRVGVFMAGSEAAATELGERIVAMARRHGASNDGG